MEEHKDDGVIMPAAGRTSVEMGADGSNGDANAAPPVHPFLARDPEVFECPCGGCLYDLQKRSPYRAPCACRRLVCRKCSGTALPDGCGLCCGAQAEGLPAEGPSPSLDGAAPPAADGDTAAPAPAPAPAPTASRDIGVLLALQTTMPVVER